jgi:hypothetical protein
MKTLLKISGVLLLFLTMTSCFFDGVKGNRNVVTEQRKISSDFDAIDVSQGIDVYLTIGQKVSLSLEADENLHDIIITEVKDGTLHIYAEKNIWSAKRRRVYVTALSINEVTASSGANVKSENTIKAEDFEVRATSGSDVDLLLKVENLTCKTTSGADAKLKGRATNFTAKSTSGGSIKAKGLEANNCNAKATSGADIYISVDNELTAEATSGGDIHYYGDPKVKHNNVSSSGSIRSN